MADSSVAGLLAADSDSVHISPLVSNRSEEKTPVSNVSPLTSVSLLDRLCTPKWSDIFWKRKVHKVLLIQPSSAAAKGFFHSECFLQ